MTCDVTMMRLMVSQWDDGGQKGPVRTQRPLLIPQMIYALEKKRTSATSKDESRGIP